MRSVMDHILAMALFIAMLVEFLLVQKAGTSTFFLLMIIAAGRRARRLHRRHAQRAASDRSRRPGLSRGESAPKRRLNDSRANATACVRRHRPMAECTIGRDRLFRRGAAAGAGLRRLARRGDEMRDEIGVRTTARCANPQPLARSGRGERERCSTAPPVPKRDIRGFTPVARKQRAGTTHRPHRPRDFPNYLGSSDSLADAPAALPSPSCGLQQFPKRRP